MIAAVASSFAPRKPGPASPHQRLYIRTLMQQLDLDVRYVTSAHLRFFRAAGLPEPEPGSNVDAVLCGLTTHSASALAGALKKEVPDAD